MNIMSTLSMSRMVVPVVVVGAAVVATLVFAERYVNPQPSDDHAIAAAPPAATKPAVVAKGQDKDQDKDQEPTGLAAVQAETNRLTATLESAPPAERGADAPEFDVATIQPTGEAVIAGRAAPGATVELLRNGEAHDRVVADQSGLFVMIPRQLPPGTYDLTLRSRQADGKEATSKQHVAGAIVSPASEQPTIALAKPDAPSRSVPSGPAAPVAAAETRKIERGAAAAQTAPSGSTGAISPRPPRVAAAGATALPGLTPPSTTAISPKGTTAIVVRGDSLWRISQRSLGAGVRYSVLYRANRDRIRNANLIYPGQVFILPSR
jgi:LysM repeat protein